MTYWQYHCWFQPVPEKEHEMMVQAGRAELNVTSITGKIIFEGGAGVASSISDGNRN